MPHDPFRDVYTRPKTAGHLQDVLAKLKQNLDSLGTYTDSLAAVIFGTGTASSAITAFQVVRSDGAGTVTPAQATSQAGSDIVGIATAAASMGAAVTYQTTGVVDYTPGGLTPGSIYYLSAAVAGGITATPPSSAGQYIVVVGKATAANKLVLQIGQGILI